MYSGMNGDLARQRRVELRRSAKRRQKDGSNRPLSRLVSRFFLVLLGLRGRA